MMNIEERKKALALEEANERQVLKDAIEEYKALGGHITICEPGARTEDITVGQWGKRRKKNNVLGPLTLRKDLPKNED
jgi:hypothetical protein|tara:strand:- start:13712 stop:13945 length:234 start_codon:yes stop_codon:yes gene_type:complete